MREAVIVAAVRTAVGRKNGALAQTRPEDLAADMLNEVVARAGIDKHHVEDVILGCVTQVSEQYGNIARVATLAAGFPIDVPGVTIDRQCGSSLQAVDFAAQAILAGDMDVVIAGGVESMSRVPMGSNRQGATRTERLSSYELVHQGLSAEKIIEQWALTEEEINTYAAQSHERAVRAIDAGVFEAEIQPIGTFRQDEGPRPGTTPDTLKGLKKIFKEDGYISAGTSSQISDGASAVLVMSAEKANALGIQPLAKIVARAVVGSDPTLMLTGPIEATKRVLQKANLTIDDMDTYEINEAFAPVPIVWAKELQADVSKLNPDGGAIALGHPLGATGTKLVTTLVHRMQRENQRYGLLSICEGMGMANAMILEKVEQ